MSRVEFETHTSLPPDKVIALLTDFSERRPEVWPGLWGPAYKVFSVGEKAAEIREGNKSPKVWARERYDWSKPGTVRWEVVESNFCQPGGFVEVNVTPSGGGSSLHVTWSRTGTSLAGRVASILIPLMKGGPVKASMDAGLRKAEAAVA